MHVTQKKKYRVTQPMQAPANAPHQWYISAHILINTRTALVGELLCCEPTLQLPMLQLQSSML